MGLDLAKVQKSAFCAQILISIQVLNLPMSFAKHKEKDHFVYCTFTYRLVLLMQ